VNLQRFSIAISTSKSTVSLPETAKLECQLLVHARVYSAADKVGLRKLKHLSSLKFFQALYKTSVDSSRLERALVAVYEGTSPDDTDLRLVLTKLCIHNAAAITKYTRLLAVIEKHELSSWRIGTSLLSDAISDGVKAMEKKFCKIIDTLMWFPRCSCSGQKVLQGTQSIYSTFGNDFVTFEPRRLEDWDGIAQVRCAKCNVAAIVSMKETI
jgi:hypothetical protein